ncbi:Clp protease ClpP, partial [Salmonella enterica]|nr:Clp protease ClpP [Salmonella enterica]
LGSITQINLHIHSPGGSIFDGLAIYNLLKNHPARKVVYVDGVACSMASVIAMVGDPVIMPENAMMMIHRPRGITGGESSDIRDYADLLDKMESVIIPIYAEKTGKSPDDIAALLASETWMSGAECVREGFADKVIQPVRAMAQLHSKRLEEFEHMPQNVKNMIIAPQGNAGTLTQPEPQAIVTPPPVAVTIPSPQPATTAPGTDEITLRARFQEEQRQRISGIQNVFGMFGNRHGELMAQCIADVDCNVDAAKDKLLEALGRGVTPTNTLGGTQNTHNPMLSHIYAGNGNFAGDGIRASLMARAGFESSQADNPYNAMTMRELARMSLTERGVGVSTLNPMQMVGMAFTHSTSDFGNILLDVANKAILQGW